MQQPVRLQDDPFVSDTGSGFCWKSYSLGAPAQTQQDPLITASRTSRGLYFL